MLMEKDMIVYNWRRLTITGLARRIRKCASSRRITQPNEVRAVGARSWPHVFAIGNALLTGVRKLFRYGITKSSDCTEEFMHQSIRLF